METLKKILQNNSVQIIIIAGGVAITLVNIWLTSKLAPLSEDIRSINTRVEAIETRNDKADQVLNRIDVIEERTISIKEQLNRIENLLE